MRQYYVSRIFLVLMAALLVLTSCNMPRADQQTTPDVTQAYQTVQARLTQGIQATAPAVTTVAGAATPTTAAVTGAQPTGAATAAEVTPTTTATPRPTTVPPTAVTKACDQAGAGSPLDVTIPDGTTMTPGQSFTKTWRLVNVGTCTWTTDYTIALFSGEDMDSPAGINLTKSVPPGESIDVSAELAAPENKTGTLRGNWKLRNAAGNWFGIGPGGASPFWVEINVTGHTATPTDGGVVGSATATPGSGNIASGSVTLDTGEMIDLDNGGVGTSGGDLLYKLNQQGNLNLSPQSSAKFAVGEFAAPTQEDCQAADLKGSSMPTKELSPGQYICYKTDQGYYGYIKIVNMDVTNKQLVLKYYTWLSD